MTKAAKATPKTKQGRVGGMKHTLGKTAMILEVSHFEEKKAAVNFGFHIFYQLIHERISYPNDKIRMMPL